MVCTNWRDRHSLPPYDDVSRKKEKIMWTRRFLLYITIIVCFVFFIIDDIKIQPSKISLESFENKRFPLPKTIITFNNNSIFGITELYVFVFDENDNVPGGFAFSSDPSVPECVVGEEETPCPTPLFQRDSLEGFVPGKSVAIQESSQWELPNFEGNAFVLGFGSALPLNQQPANPSFSNVLEIQFTTDKCEDNNCEQIYTSSIIPTQGLASITLDKYTIIDKNKKHITSFPFTVGSVALSDEDVNVTLTDLELSAVGRDVLFAVRIETNAKIVSTVHLETKGQLVLRIIVDALGVFGGIVILGDIAMKLVNKCLFTGTDTIDHGVRDPALQLIREQIQQMQREMQQYKPQAQQNNNNDTSINMAPMGAKA